MIKNLVVGSGFSAAITKIFLGKDSKIIGFKKKNLFKNQKSFRRKSLDINKFFSKKIISYGSLKFELNKGDNVKISCVDYDTSNEYPDHLRIAINNGSYQDWLNNKAYK